MGRVKLTQTMTVWAVSSCACGNYDVLNNAVVKPTWEDAYIVMRHQYLTTHKSLSGQEYKFITDEIRENDATLEVSGTKYFWNIAKTEVSVTIE